MIVSRGGGGGNGRPAGAAHTWRSGRKRMGAFPQARCLTGRVAGRICPSNGTPIQASCPRRSHSKNHSTKLAHGPTGEWVKSRAIARKLLMPSESCYCLEPPFSAPRLVIIQSLSRWFPWEYQSIGKPISETTGLPAALPFLAIARRSLLSKVDFRLPIWKL